MAPDTALQSSSALPSHHERFPGIFKFILHPLKQQLGSNQNTEGGKVKHSQGGQNLSLIVFHATTHLSSLFTSYSSHSEV